MDRKKKVKNDKRSNKDLSKNEKGNDALRKQYIEMSPSDKGKEKKRIEMEVDDNLAGRTSLVGSELMRGDVPTWVKTKAANNSSVIGNKTSIGSTKTLSFTDEQEERANCDVHVEENLLSPFNTYKWKNIKNNEIFERNTITTKDEMSPKKLTPFALQRDKDDDSHEFNKSKQFLEDMDTFKKKKKKMDEMVSNIGNGRNTESMRIMGSSLECANMNDEKQEGKFPHNIEEKETVSYTLKKQKKIEKYNMSTEEKEEHMKKYMIKLEEQYKKKKEEELRKEIDERKEEVKKFQEKENTFLNYLKNPRLKLSKNEDLNDYLSICPKTIHFTDVTKGVTLKKDLLITNKSNTLLHVIIVPPSTEHFFIKDIINVYNKSEENSKNNLNNQIAPGHSIKIRVCYDVFTLTQQRDHIKLLSEAGNKTVEIKAFQSIPQFSFQRVLNFGPIRPNERKKKCFAIKNEGKETNVMILPKKLFTFYDKKKKFEKEENILNLLIKKKEESKEIKEISENKDSYYMYNNVKSYSYNFLFLYKKLVNHFEDLYFENVLQDCYYFNVNNLEDKIVTFNFKSSKVGIYEKDYVIVTDIECDFGELEDKRKCNFVYYKNLNIFEFSVKAIVEPILLNLLRINKYISSDFYRHKLEEYLQNGEKDNLSYFFYSNMLNSVTFSDIQVNSGYNFAEVEVLNGGLIDLKVSCSIYVREDEKDGDPKQVVLERECKGMYYYKEYFDVSLAQSLYEKLGKGSCATNEGKVEEEEENEKKAKKRICPIYIYPRNFVLSYNKRQKIYIIFKPQEKHENYKNYYFLLEVKNVSKGSDIQIEDLIEIHKNREEKNNGFPLICVGKNKIVKSKKWNKLFKNNISTYENSSSSSFDDTYSSYSDISEGSLKKKQCKKKTYFNKKRKKRNFIGLCMPIYANIIKPNVHLKMNNASKCFLVNPLHLYKTTFTIKNENNFYVNYYFENLINMNDSPVCDKAISLSRTSEICGEGPKKLENSDGDVDLSSEGKKQKDIHKDKSVRTDSKHAHNTHTGQKAYVCYYDYFKVLNDIRLRMGEKKNKRSSSSKGKEKTKEDKSNMPSNVEVDINKRNSKKNPERKHFTQIENKKHLKGEKGNNEEDVPSETEIYYNLSKGLIKYFHQKGDSDHIRMYVLVRNGERINKSNVGDTKNANCLRRDEAVKNVHANEYKNGGKRTESTNHNILKKEEGEYCLMPHEKKKIVLYFLVNKYGYHDINLKVIFYMGNYKMGRSITAGVLTKCRGVSIDKNSFIFNNSYSHYSFCNVVKVKNRDKDLKLIHFDNVTNVNYGFVSLYHLYSCAFTNKDKRKKLMKHSDLLTNFEKNFYQIVENEMDKNYIKKENSEYNCDMCKCFFKYDNCIEHFRKVLSNWRESKNHIFHFNEEKYVIQNMKQIKELEKRMDKTNVNAHFKDIYKYHQNKIVYIHNNKADLKTQLIIYPSSLLLLPLGETFFLFFFFFSHAGRICSHINVKWNHFNEKIFIEGESKNQAIKITYDKKVDDKKGDMKGEMRKKEKKMERREENYVGICSNIFHVNIENTNDLEILYQFGEVENGQFEYNYHKRKYALVHSCNPKLNCYYKNFDAFIKINDVKNVTPCCNLNERRGERVSEKNDPIVLLGEEEENQSVSSSKEENSKAGIIHGCVITSHPILNKINGKEKKKHEFRLLLFHDNITKNENYVKLRFCINLKYFDYRKIIKVSSHFFLHTFDFIIMSENNLLVSLFRYMKMVTREGNGAEVGTFPIRSESYTLANEGITYGYEAGTYGADKENGELNNSFVNEMIEELHFIEGGGDNHEVKISRKEEFIQISKLLNFNIDEDVLEKLQCFVDEVGYTFGDNTHLCNNTRSDGRLNENEDGEDVRRDTQGKQRGGNDNLEEIHSTIHFNTNDNNVDNTNKVMNERIRKIIWAHKLIEGLNNKVGCDFVDFAKRYKYELGYMYEMGEAQSEEQRDIWANKKKKGKEIDTEEGPHKIPSINSHKNYRYQLYDENDAIYIVINNKNKYDLGLSVHSDKFTNDSLNNIYHCCLNNLIMKREWQGLHDFVNEYKVKKGKKGYYKKWKLDKLTDENCRKLKHLTNKYREINDDHYYYYFSKILKEKNGYCLNLKRNFFLDFFIFQNVVNSMKCAFIKLYLYADNVNLYRDRIILNLNKRKSICNISISSHIKSLHLLSHHKIMKNGDKCIFINALFVNKEILKNYEHLSRNEKNEEIEKICACFEQILKPYEFTIFNSSNLRKSMTWNFCKISHFINEKRKDIKRASADANIESVRMDNVTFTKWDKAEDGSDGNVGKGCIIKKTSSLAENRFYVPFSTGCTSGAHDADTADTADTSDGGNEIKIESSNNYINGKEKKNMRICLEGILHKEGNHLYKISCSYKYVDQIGSERGDTKELASRILSEQLKKLLSLQFYMCVHIAKPEVALLHNNQAYRDRIIKFDYNYFNKKAYKKVDKMYKNELINDILYEDVNEINEYFDEIFLKNKNLKLYFINQEDTHFYAYMYTNNFFKIKNVYIDSEEFGHSNTRIYYIKSQSKVCIKLEIDELKFKNEIKNNTSHNTSLNNKIDKKYMYQDFLIFQYLTSKKKQKFCIECNYNVPFIIMKENKYIFQEFNNLKRKNQIMENCKELNDVMNNLSDKIKMEKIIYNEIEMRNDAYLIHFSFSELKIYKLCLFLFNTTKIPATWTIKEEGSSDEISHSMKNGENKIFQFSKTKDTLFGKTYEMDNINYGKDEKRTNPFLFPNYIIVTFTPIRESDITKKYSINIAHGAQIDFYLKGIYLPKNYEQTKSC
ncbi:conserved Plasmodium protein, unknown function [Plasmodium ovale]|uniref:Uncharacterized protein n=1 Tax=Plasmodium ovale TaxID=36330 RepID=A0A1D3TLS0_PLAOA|nr:conserved Plasmodium protein, unknown function [Plasmodium ovale]